MTTKSEVLKAIRRYCIDCSGGQIAKVRKCPVLRCDLWPYRFGMDPNPSKTRGFKKSTHRRSVSSKKRISDGDPDDGSQEAV